VAPIAVSLNEVSIGTSLTHTPLLTTRTGLGVTIEQEYGMMWNSPVKFGVDLQGDNCEVRSVLHLSSLCALAVSFCTLGIHEH